MNVEFPQAYRTPFESLDSVSGQTMRGFIRLKPRCRFFNVVIVWSRPDKATATILLDRLTVLPDIPKDAFITFGK